ncbi:MAG: DEAD/DEAH box helicase [Desulfobacteraceae bacterium]|nr:DEAD/DEAH box helicase [Desulfobacteraceae bacterium]
MSFKPFNFHPSIIRGITACGYNSPTPIQKEAIPPILDGQDIFGLAQTGTGKTAAFVLPILERLLKRPGKKVRALIMAPTRELAEQINVNIKQFAIKTNLKSVSIYGGVSKIPQIKAIQDAHIIVSCPGRLLDLINDRAVSLDNIEVLVLDEADHMFDKGFLPDIKRIIKQLPQKRQSLVFSATMPKEIKRLAEKILHNPVTVQINHSLPVQNISHSLFQIKKEQRTSLLKYLFKEDEMKSALVFTRTKHKAKSLARQLDKAGYSATSLQGNLTQQKRQKALNGFRDGNFKILVATDIAARGIDVLQISHVINYDLPDTVETYTHRTGRTGRAGEKGKAYTFVSPEDTKMITLIERNLGKKIQKATAPSFDSSQKSSRHGNKHRKTSVSNKKPRCLWSKSLALA